MSLFASTISPEVGLKLILSPLGSNVVLRTACCSIGTVLPVYSTFKAIENKNQSEQQKWLVYWAAYGSFSVVEAFADKLISWFPFYYHVKFAFLVWLQLPSADGAKHMYMSYLRPFLLRHQVRLDQIAGYLHSEMAKFFIAHQGELLFVKNLFMKMLTSARDIVHPTESQAGRRIGSSAPKPDSESENEDEDVE